jgi:hypothetical protein
VRTATGKRGLLDQKLPIQPEDLERANAAVSR